MAILAIMVRENSMTLTHRTYLVVVLLVAAWCGGILLAPALSGSMPGVSSALYACYEPICHQIDARSFHSDGGKLAVCARCSSIYFTFLLALIAYPLFRRLSEQSLPSRFWIVVAIGPMVVDVTLNFLGLHGSTLLTRAVSGGLFGLIVPWYIIPVLVEAVSQLRSQLLSRGGLFYARKAQ
ncbi:MAG TPA: hypothetical protein DEP53_16740 [Bacteroidetes bacterium]|nr:hypothetical protein [Bacteroidota bacterium]